MTHPVGDTSGNEAPSVKGLGIADLCIKRPVFATMLTLFLVVLGWFSFQSIGVDQFPNVELPIITVTTTLRGASPEEMETSVTKPLEEIINTVQGVDELSSVTLEGVSRITVQFLYERNLDAIPIISISISAPRDLREITYLADKQIKQNLETVHDVGAVNLVGARIR